MDERDEGPFEARRPLDLHVQLAPLLRIRLGLRGGQRLIDPRVRIEGIVRAADRLRREKNVEEVVRVGDVRGPADEAEVVLARADLLEISAHGTVTIS